MVGFRADAAAEYEHPLRREYAARARDLQRRPETAGTDADKDALRRERAELQQAFETKLAGI